VTVREKDRDQLPFVLAKDKFVLLFSHLGKNLFYVIVGFGCIEALDSK
jgi:hypothetical protein